MYVPFSKRLRELRLKNGLTQKELALHLNYGYTAIANYESGKNEPSIKDLIKLANILHVSLDYLMGVSNTYSNFGVDERWREFNSYVPQNKRHIVYDMIEFMVQYYKKSSKKYFNKISGSEKTIPDKQ